MKGAPAAPQQQSAEHHKISFLGLCSLFHAYVHTVALCGRVEVGVINKHLQEMDYVPHFNLHITLNAELFFKIPQNDNYLMSRKCNTLWRS